MGMSPSLGTDFRRCGYGSSNRPSNIFQLLCTVSSNTRQVLEVYKTLEVEEKLFLVCRDGYTLSGSVLSRMIRPAAVVNVCAKGRCQNGHICFFRSRIA